MSIELNRLTEKAFFAEEVANASEALARAMQKFEQVTHTGARAFEIVAPADPDEAWLREQLVHRLVYFCESEGMPVPECGGMVVALYVGPWMYGIPGAEVLRWASGVLSASIDQFRAEYGTHEIDTALR
jgi:hypothetical protein